MIDATSDYIEAATADRRDPRARIEVIWTSPEVDPTVTASANDTNRSGDTLVSDLVEQAADGVVQTPRKWAYVGPSMKADGTFYAAPAVPADPQLGWYSQSSCDAFGVFAVNPIITVAFAERPITYIDIIADTVYAEYPVNFIFAAYSGVTLLFEQAIVGNNKVSVRLNLESEGIVNCDSIVLTVTKWSKGNEIVKIVEFYGGLSDIYRSDEIMSLSILEELNSDSGTLPIGNISANELDIELSNENDRFRFGNTDSLYEDLLKMNRKISAWLGFALPNGSADVSDIDTGYLVEWEGSRKIGYLPYGVYYSKDWVSSYRTMTLNTSAFDIMDRLRTTIFTKSLLYQDVTFFELTEILMAAAAKEVSGLSWAIDAGLADHEISVAWFPRISFFECLRIITEATGTYTYVDRQGTIVVGEDIAGKTPDTPTVSNTADLSTYFGFESVPKSDEMSNEITIVQKAYGTNSEDSDIYSSDDRFRIPEFEQSISITLPWSSVPVDPETVVITTSSSNTIITEQVSYVWGAEITVARRAGLASITFSISAVGVVYGESDASDYTATDDISIAEFGKKEYAIADNSLLQSGDMAKTIADGLLASYKDVRKDADIDWPGNTIVGLADSMYVTEFKNDSIETKDYFLINRQQIEFDGSLQVKTELRRLT